MAFPRGFHPARGPRSPPGGVLRPGEVAPHPLPRRSFRNVCSVWGSQSDTQLQECLRHGRGRHRGTREQPGVGMRLFRCYPLLRRLRQRPRGATDAHSKRHMHEEDFSLLWKHLEYNEDGSTRAEVRRSRRLVISMIATVGNYEYGYYWYLYQDGSLQFEVKLTGIIAPAAIAPGEQPVSGTLVAPGLYGPNHQHYFNVRIDWMLDGQENSVYEVNCEPLPWGPENPRGNGWVARETQLATENEAQRTIDPRSSRYWKIVNPTRRNAVGNPIAYKLVPGANAFPFFHEGSPQWERGGFVRHHLWVTAYNPQERYAAGDYPNQQRGGDGLPAYVQQNPPWWQPMSSPGIPLAPITLFGQRTGQSCRWICWAFTSSPSASSTEIPPSTFPLPWTTATTNRFDPGCRELVGKEDHDILICLCSLRDRDRSKYHGLFF